MRLDQYAASERARLPGRLGDVVHPYEIDPVWTRIVPRQRVDAGTCELLAREQQMLSPRTARQLKHLETENVLVERRGRIRIACHECGPDPLPRSCQHIRRITTV